MFFRSRASGRDIFEHSFVVRERTEHGGLHMPQLGVDGTFVVFDPGGLAPSSPKSFDHLFHMARVGLLLSKALENSIAPFW